MIYKNLYDVLVELIQNELKSKANNQLWKEGDRFFDIRKLQIDQRGRVGEHFFKIIFEELNLFREYVNNGHGDWDIETIDFKIEIKTATLDINHKFQHEGIKKSKLWDVIAFLDISPNLIYITFLHKNDFEFGLKNIDTNKEYGKVNLYGNVRNIHFRGKDNTDERATGAGYKVDFKEIELKPVRTIKDVEILYLEMKNKIK